MTASRSIKKLIQDASPTFTPSERKLVRFLNSATPVIALGSVHQLAERVSVSAPTVMRFAVKLGFSGYADFQQAWVNELESMLTSPLTLIDHGAPPSENLFGRELGKMVEQGIDEVAGEGGLLDVLLDSKRRIYLRGGRFSQPLADYFYAHLREIRGNAEILGRSSSHDIDLTLDLSKKDVVIIFDYRRYQVDTVHLAKRASEQGATVVLFTDRWQSTAAEFSRHVIVSDIASGSAYDSLVPAMAQVEYLAMEMVNRLGVSATDRLRRLEAVRAGQTPANDRDRSELS